MSDNSLLIEVNEKLNKLLGIGQKPVVQNDESEIRMRVRIYMAKMNVKKLKR